QPDKPVGRKQILTPPHTKAYLLEVDSSIPIFQPQNLKNEEAYTFINNFDPDFIVVAAFGQILPKNILDIAPCINLHASILPAFRGASPIQDAILSQEKFSGVTAMKMDVGLDTGDILAFTYINIENMDAIELFATLSTLAASLTLTTLKTYPTIAPLKQLDADTSYAKKIKKEDGLVDFKDAKLLDAKYRAFIYWPGVFCESGLKLKELALHESEGHYQKGEIVELADGYAIIGCEKGTLNVSQVQAPSKKQVDIISYLRGKRLSVGDILS
ncbi:MAG TPA: methionyl-tRNA formyltransferase, partial [Campylobacterales bacterium]|nr:methionyl-tRNA formyltransferase [Campylobacterales bacterium]